MLVVFNTNVGREHGRSDEKVESQKLMMDYPVWKMRQKKVSIISRGFLTSAISCSRRLRLACSSPWLVSLGTGASQF
jgi:hypothetical protein